jgi:flagellar basal-body rod modification protein FlgD
VSTISTIGQDAATPTVATTTPGTPATIGTEATATAKATKSPGGFGMDKDAFLKILVEQLRHQDPSQPGDSQQYIQQMTQYSMLEQLTNISEAVQTQHSDGAANTAMGLVGRTVTWTDDKKVEHSGVVDKVDFDESGATLTVGGTAGVELRSITEVR